MKATNRAFARSLLIALVLSCLSLAAQDTTSTGTSAQDKPVATFSSSVKVVNLFATVRDKKGNIVKDLNKEDFKLLQDGQPQNIRYFTRETDLPLTLGLLVDTSLSQRRMIDEERTASFAFLNEFMRVDKDKAFVMHFDWGAELLQDLTANTQKLQAALDKVDLPGNSLSGAPRPANADDDDAQKHRGGSTTLYDAVFLASDEILRKPEGRKAIILLTDGVDEGSKTSLERAIEAAQRSNTLIYTIYYSDPEAYGRRGFGHVGMGGGGMGHPGAGWPGGGGGYPSGPGGGGPPQQREQHLDGKKVLERMSHETGGRFFEVTKKNPINQIYDQIGEELRNQYSIGYSPDKAVAGPGYHKIQLETTNKNFIVQAREGYYAQP